MNRPKYYQNLAKFPGMQNTTQDCAIQVRVVFCLVFYFITLGTPNYTECFVLCTHVKIVV